MIFLVRLAFRNVLRHPRRSLLSAAPVVAGVAVSILGMGFVGGLDENVIRAQINTASGHVLLRGPGVSEDGLSHEIDGLEPLPESLVKRLEGLNWTSRVEFDLRIVGGVDAIRAVGVGYDPDREGRVFSRDTQQLEGAWPTERGVVVGSGLAAVMDLDVGDSVMLQARTSQGAQNAMSVEVVGLVSTQNLAVDNSRVFLPMPLAQEFVRVPGPSHVAIRLDRRSEAAATAKRLDTPWKATTFRDEAADILSINRVRRKAISLLVLVVMGIAATGIANTVIMAVYERVREVGTLLAMGMPPRSVRALFLLEGAFMGAAAATSGAVLGAWGNHHLSTVGISLEGLPDAGAQLGMSATLYTAFSWWIVLGAAVFGIGVAVLSSLWPAGHAASLAPALAVRDRG